MRKRVLLLAFFAGTLPHVPAQQPAQPPPQTNPLIQLMQSQPPIDISSPVVATATFDPPVVRPGEKCIYRVSFNALETSVRWTQPLTAPPQLKLRPGAHGQVLRPAGTVLNPLTTFNFEVRASSAGFFLIPRFAVEIYGKPVVVPDAGLEVATDLEAQSPPRQLLLEPAATNLFVGQTMSVRVLLPAVTPNMIEFMKEVQLNGDGFAVEKNAVRQTIGVFERAGQRGSGFIYDTTVTPISAGTLTLSAQGFTAGREFNGSIVITGPVTIPGGVPQYVLLESEPVPIKVRLLPTEGQLPGFTGAIGRFTADPPQLATNRVRVGEPLELFVTIRGENHLAKLQMPEPPQAKGWQIFPAVAKGFVPPTGTTNAGAVFAYTLIPLTDELHATPPIPFSGFDPARPGYVDLTIPPVAITVLPDAMATNLPVTVTASERDVAGEKKPTLSPVLQTRGKTVGSLEPLQLRVWFVLLQAAPLLGFAALWQWDRRRRYLEQHPEIVRRRRARRELRKMKRALSQAASATDAPRFTQSAVSAVQIAGAPHYPAHPRALVCADVLNLLPEDQRQGKTGDTIRRFFAAADSANFAADAESPVALLALKPELDAILLQLEERL